MQSREGKTLAGEVNVLKLKFRHYNFENYSYFE